MAKPELIPEDLFERFERGMTISGQKLPCDEDPQTAGLGWRLRGYTEALESLFCEFTPGSDSQASALLERTLPEVRTWDSVGDMPGGNAPDERARSIALGAAFALLCIDRVVETLQAGAPTLACVIAWDQLCDAHAETVAQSLFLRFEDGSIERKRLAQAGAIAKHAQTPFAPARQFVRQCWLEWKDDPERYPSLSAFARDMMDKLPGVAANPVTFERWVRRWRLDVELEQ